MTAIKPDAIDWNGQAGRNWVEAQTLLDRTLKPFEDILAGAVREAGAKRVLDIGCGVGAVTRAAAREAEQSVGIDIAAPMIEAAKTQAAKENSSARFILADAETYAFEPASFDLTVSRFGVMFFNNVVAAFANIRAALRSGGALCWIAWRGPEENPFMTAAGRAAASVLPDLAPYQPNAPGPFGLADSTRTRALLGEAGWRDIRIDPIDADCTLPASALEFYFTRLGPLGRVFAELDPDTQRRAIDAVRPAFDPFVQGDDARYTAKCWRIAARAP